LDEKKFTYNVRNVPSRIGEGEREIDNAFVGGLWYLEPQWKFGSVCRRKKKMISDKFGGI